MEFGRLPDVRGVDFALPPDPAATLHGVVEGRHARDLDLRIGLAGWSDPGFAGTLVPEGTPRSGFLACHAQVFTTNELNSTYYGVNVDRLRAWASSVPDGFRFCPKLPATITHERRLAGADDDMARFVDAVAVLGDRLGVTWGVLPPMFGPRDLAVLERFVATWAGRLPLALELRHAGWFSDARVRADAFGLLREHGVIAVLCDVAGRRDVLHMEVTAPATMLRLVGNHPDPSDHARVDAWCERLADWTRRGLERAWVFLHQRKDPDAVGLARRLSERWRDRTGVDPLPGLGRPPVPPGGVQGTLF